MVVIYNETNYTELFGHIPISFNQTQEAGISLINGSGSWQYGYTSAYCRVEGFDLLMQLQIVQTVLLAILLFVITFYVAIYTWRMMTYD